MAYGENRATHAGIKEERRMLYPEINKLRDTAGSRYFLVSMASKRARDIIDGKMKLDERITSTKPVSIAAEEIGEDLFTYREIEEAEETEEMEAEAEVAEEDAQEEAEAEEESAENTEGIF